MPRCLPTSAILALLTAMGLPAAATADGHFADRTVATFVAADGDGDAHLSFREFRAFIATMAAQGQPTSRRIRAFGAYGLAFNRIDTNDDGLASPDELRAADRSYRARQS